MVKEEVEQAAEDEDVAEDSYALASSQFQHSVEVILYSVAGGLPLAFMDRSHSAIVLNKSGEEFGLMQEVKHHGP